MHKILFNKSVFHNKNQTNFIKTSFEDGVTRFANIDEIYSDFPDCIKVNGDNRYTETYRNIELEIVYNKAWLCGYVYYFPDKRDKYPLNLEKLSQDTEDGKGLYIPHGGYTWKYGFDCHHLTHDIPVNKWTGRIERYQISQEGEISFKSFSFVLEECRKIIDSLHKIKI